MRIQNRLFWQVLLQCLNIGDIGVSVKLAEAWPLHAFGIMLYAMELCIEIICEMC